MAPPRSGSVIGEASKLALFDQHPESHLSQDSIQILQKSSAAASLTPSEKQPKQSFVRPESIAQSLNQHVIMEAVEEDAINTYYKEPARTKPETGEAHHTFQRRA